MNRANFTVICRRDRIIIIGAFFDIGKFILHSFLQKAIVTLKGRSQNSEASHDNEHKIRLAEGEDLMAAQLVQLQLQGLFLRCGWRLRARS
jgi:hypothetical protein